MIGIIIPTYHRPHALERAMKNADENTHSLHTIYFVVEPDDWDSIWEIERIGGNIILSYYPGSHTGAANTAYEMTEEPFFIIANDDFNFHKDWDVPALKAMEDPKVGAVGLNDGSGSGVFTAITLVRRAYIEKHSGVMDVPNILYYPKYNHNYVDTEFSNTAKKRGMWAVCPESIVEHMHWSFNKANKDATYEKSSGTASADGILYESRKHLFT